MPFIRDFLESFAVCVIRSISSAYRKSSTICPLIFTPASTDCSAHSNVASSIIKQILRQVTSLSYSRILDHSVSSPSTQFLQVGRLYRALIFLGLALWLPSASVFLVFMVYISFFLNAYILFFTFKWPEPGGIGPWRDWLTIILRCYDTVVWVIWPLKSFPKWPIMCRVGR